MKKILLLMMFMLACSNFISAQSVEENCKMRSVILCDKSEKNILMYIINEKYCFLSTKENNIVTLFNPSQIFKITIIAPSQKKEFKEYVEKYCINYKNQIAGIFCIKLKEGEKLPGRLAAYYK